MTSNNFVSDGRAVAALAQSNRHRLSIGTIMEIDERRFGTAASNELHRLHSWSTTAFIVAKQGRLLAHLKLRLQCQPD